MKMTLTLTQDWEHACIHFPICFAQIEHQLTQICWSLIMCYVMLFLSLCHFFLSLTSNDSYIYVDLCIVVC